MYNGVYKLAGVVLFFSRFFFFCDEGKINKIDHPISSPEVRRQPLSPLLLFYLFGEVEE